MLNNEYNLVEDFSKLEKKPMRDGYGEAMVEMARNNPRVVVLIADLLESLKLAEFKKEFPKRTIEVGIQEQNMMGMAGGLALSGKIPFVNSFACFSPGRNWEQLRISVCLTKNNVKVIGGHAGFGNGADGANQQSFEDMAITRVLPNMTVLAPVDYEQIKKAVWRMAELEGPIYMRMTKPAREVMTTRTTPFEIGKAQVFREGSDVTVFACGAMVYEAMMAAKRLEGEMEVEVINVHTIKPLDVETVVRSARKTGKVVTAEEHSIIGGLGSAVAEALGENFPVPIRRVGMRDLFGESGEPDELRQKYGLTATDLVKEIKKLVNKNE
jgi:transketolase